ncbi:uncharacterized protein LOC128962814 [Oppia nitens]|uniref:uncharacterized protein LOC128962814 n=1 Tax=Oppia nitens TaxID=1686743 RepID=UPI0023DC1010|nr:uncharacterized protein LOC128962814 [Oppia nitens]
MKVIYMIVLLVLMLTITSVVTQLSKDFCEEYRKNYYKIDFSMSLYKRYGHCNDTILLFIGNTYWKLSIIDGLSDKTVTIDTVSAGATNWLFANKYSMAWSFNIDINDYDDYDKQKIATKYYPLCRISALQKDMHTIDWIKTSCNDMNITFGIKSSEITFSYFKPFVVWIVYNYDRFATKMIAFADSTKHLHYLVNQSTGALSYHTSNDFYGWKWTGRQNIIAISQQYTYNCSDTTDPHHNQSTINKNNCLNSMGSIVLMYGDYETTIQYSYAHTNGRAIEYAYWKSAPLKTLIDCSQQTNSQSIIIITIIVISIVFAIVLSVVITINVYDKTIILASDERLLLKTAKPILQTNTYS